MKLAYDRVLLVFLKIYHVHIFLTFEAVGSETMRKR